LSCAFELVAGFSRACCGAQGWSLQRSGQGPGAPNRRQPGLRLPVGCARGPISRVLFPFGRRPFLWDACCHAPQATNPRASAGSGLRVAPRDAPIRSCSRWGLPCHPCCQGRGALLPHPFDLAAIPDRVRDRAAVCFLLHCPWGHPRRALPATVDPWSPDFPRVLFPTPAAAWASGTTITCALHRERSRFGARRQKGRPWPTRWTGRTISR